jgi:hypothetical protein
MYFIYQLYLALCAVTVFDLARAKLPREYQQKLAEFHKLEQRKHFLMELREKRAQL